MKGAKKRKDEKGKSPVNFMQDKDYQKEDWQKKSGKNDEGGLNEKGRKSYERENPGSDLKRPSKKVESLVERVFVRE